MKEKLSCTLDAVWAVLPRYLAEDVAAWDRAHDFQDKFAVWPSIDPNALRIGARRQPNLSHTFAVTIMHSATAILVEIERIGAMPLTPVLENGKCRVLVGKEAAKLELREVSRRILSLAGFH